MVMSDLANLRLDLRAFAEAVGQPLASWQAASLRLDHRTTVLVAPRQSGKSRSLAATALWWAYGRPGQRVLVVSAGEDASRRLLAQAASIAITSPLLSGSVTDETSGLLILSNQSEIRSVPASERAVRGWSTDLLLIDEAAQVDDELLLGAAIPTTAARPNARIVLASSPGGGRRRVLRLRDGG
jgi:tRNA(Met) C34 N-acetyltransferase TmcA